MELQRVKFEYVFHNQSLAPPVSIKYSNAYTDYISGIYYMVLLSCMETAPENKQIHENQIIFKTVALQGK